MRKKVGKLKKFMAILLSLVICVSLMPSISAFAEGETTVKSKNTTVVASDTLSEETALSTKSVHSDELTENHAYEVKQQKKKLKKLGNVGDVTASAEINPKLSGATEKPNFKLNSNAGNFVYILSSNVLWERKGDDNIWHLYFGDTFDAGTYRLKVTLISQVFHDEYYAFTKNTTFTVNGMKWDMVEDSVEDHFNETGYGFVKFVSGEYEVTGDKGHTITITDDGHGSAVAALSHALPGTEVSLEPTPNPGYVFDKFEIISGDGRITKGRIYIMGSQDAVIKAHFIPLHKAGTISTVKAKSDDISGSTVEIGAEAKYPKLTLIYPTGKGVTVAPLMTRWLRKGDDGEWDYYKKPTFEEGLYKLSVQLRSESLEDGSYYELTDDATFSVNGTEWTAGEKFLTDYSTKGYGGIFFTSKEFIAAPKFEKRADVSVDGTSLGHSSPSHTVSANKQHKVIFTWEDISDDLRAKGYKLLVELKRTTPNEQLIYYTSDMSKFTDNGNGTYSATYSTSQETGVTEKVELSLWLVDSDPHHPPVGGPNTNILTLNFVDDTTKIPFVDIKVTKPSAGAEPTEPTDLTPNTWIKSYEWHMLDKNGNMISPPMASTDKFEEGKTYRCQMAVFAKDGFTFTDTANAKINGNPVTPFAQFANSLFLEYDFKVMPVPRYSLTVIDSHAATTGAGKYSTGEKVNIHAGERDGYDFAGWTSKDDIVFDDANAIDTTFTMPDADVSVTANWKKKGSTPPVDTYTVTIASPIEHGSVSADKTSELNEGDLVTLNVSPEAGYVLEDLIVKDEGTNPVTMETPTSFKMPASNVTVNASFKKAPIIPQNHDVHINPMKNGTVTSDKSQAVEGELVKLTVTPKDGYELESLEVHHGLGAYITLNADNSFTMPNDDVIVNATFRKVSVTYKVVSGMNGTWTNDSSQDYELVVKRSPDDSSCFRHFSGVSIDGVSLTAGTDYEAKAGSTIVKVKASVLKKLGVGKHTITVDFDDGSVNTALNIKAKPIDDNKKTTPLTGDNKKATPSTGDDRQSVIWLTILLLSLAGASGASVYYMRKRNAR